MNIKSFHIITFGCQMNENDSLQLSKILEQNLGLSFEQDASKSDVIIINTCSVREKPEHKVFSEIGRFTKIKKNRKVIIGIIGCVAQEYGNSIFKRSDIVDFVAGTHNIDKIPDMILNLANGKKKISSTEFYDNIKSINIFTKPYDKAGVKAYVTIMQGCENFCSYCIVPYVRGREYSRKSSDILDEIKYLADKGVKEITLLGQNVNSYGKKSFSEISFTELLERIIKIDRIDRIRFTTSHPKDFDKSLIDIIAKNEKICNQIHLPVQSGSDKILKLMNRKYTKKDYLEKIYLLKRKIPNIAITTDIIVGFPYEDDNDFMETYNIVKEVGYVSSFSFKYTPRPFTKFSNIDNIPENVKNERLKSLQNLQKQITLQHNKSAIGKIFKVLIEGVSKKSDNELTGRTEDNRIVNFKGRKSLIGQFANVKIIESFQNSLKGKLIEKTL